MQAMILAAGFGTRLLPHSRLRPKPLFPLLNRPLLLLLIERLSRLGFDHLVVNCHHLRGQIVTALRAHPLHRQVVVQEERQILGTGGGLRAALPLFRDEPLLVCNGDIYHDIDLLALYRRHCAGDSPVTLAMHDFPRFNNVSVEAGQVVAFGRQPGHRQLAFTGLQVVSPRVLAAIASDRPSCIIDQYRLLLAAGEKIACQRIDGAFWTDIGTPADYLELHRGLLTGTLPRWPELGPGTGPWLVDPAAELGGEVQLGEWGAVGAARIGDRCHLARVVVWDGVEIPADCRLVDRIVSADLS